MRAVFLDVATFSPDICFSIIEQQVSVLETYELTQAEQIVERCKSAEVIISNKVPLTAEVLAELPKLKLVCIAATGTNNIDLAAAKKLGITVTNVTNYANYSVSQYVFAQLLAYFSNIEHHNQNTRSGLWQQHHSFCLHGAGMNELAGKTLAIVGYGNLGKAVAKIARAFGLKILIAERADSAVVRAGRVGFKQALTEADIVSLHCPQTSATEKLINTQHLALMKNNAVLINTARGGLIDNQALLAALEQKKLGAAILDVLDQEPPPVDHPLLNCQSDNLIITAHIAWASHQAQAALIEQLADNIKAFIHHRPQNTVVSA